MVAPTTIPCFRLSFIHFSVVILSPEISPQQITKSSGAKSKFVFCPELISQCMSDMILNFIKSTFYTIDVSKVEESKVKFVFNSLLCPFMTESSFMIILNGGEYDAN